MGKVKLPQARVPEILRRARVGGATLRVPEVASKPPKKVTKISLKAQSELGADYLRQLMPIAKELAVQRTEPKRILHRGKPLTPFKISKGQVEGDPSVIQKYYDVLTPAAHEAVAKKKVRHLKHAVKPYKK